MADIFLSYAREDLEQAADLAHAFEAEGWSVFWDRHIPPGQRFEDHLESEITRARVVVVLWSPHSIVSSWVKREAAHGRDRTPPALVPVLVAPTDLPFSFRDIQAADLSSWRRGERGLAFEALLSSIAAIAPRDSVATPPREARPRATRVGLRVAIGAAAAILVGIGLFARATRSSHSDAPVTTPPANAVSAPESRGAASQNEFIVDGTPGVHLIRIPAGPFLMGSDRSKDHDADADESWPGGAMGTVVLPEFYIGKYEVTSAQYERCIAARACAPGDNGPSPGDAPIARVSWRDAMGYCAWLGSALQDTTRTPSELRRLLASGWRVTLPSEAEWEKAARGADGRRYPWGDTYTAQRALFGGHSPSLVGTFPDGASPYGAMDMSGNVWELTRSLYRPYPYVPTDGREDLQAAAAHVMRGGSFESQARYGRAAARNYSAPPGYGDGIGFRVALVHP